MNRYAFTVALVLAACSPESRNRTDNNSDTVGKAKGLRDVRALRDASSLAAGAASASAITSRDSVVAESLHAIAPRVRSRTKPVTTGNKIDSLANVLTAVVAVDTITPPPPPQPQPPPLPPPPPSGDPSCGLTDFAPHSQAALGKPGYLQTVTDPVFGTRITRITGDPGTAVGSGVSGSWGNTARHNYAKDPAWSADQRLLVLKEMGGSLGPGVALFVDGSSYQPLFSRSGPSGGGEWRMSAVEPDIAIYVNSSGRVGKWNVRTNVSTPVFTPSGYSGASVGPDEGGLSYDARYIAVNARRSDGRQVAFVVDLQTASKSADIDVTAINQSPGIDWVSVSALGGYVVLYEHNSQVTHVWNRDGSNHRVWSDNQLGHYDLGVDAAGNEAMFGAASTGTYSKRFLYRRLDSGAIQTLSPATTWSWHSSTRADKRRGWGFATTNDRTGSVLDGEIYALKMDGSLTVQRLAHHHTDESKGYWHAPHAVPSPDGKRVLFASNWGVAPFTVSAFIVGCGP